MFFLGGYTWAYAVLFWLGLALWPLALTDTPSAMWICFLINTALLTATAYYTSGPALNFFLSFEKISRKYQSGCVNLTILYIFPVLLVYYGIAVAAAFGGIVKGRVFSQNKWLVTVYGEEGAASLTRTLTASPQELQRLFAASAQPWSPPATLVAPIPAPTPPPAAFDLYDTSQSVSETPAVAPPGSENAPSHGQSDLDRARRIIREMRERGEDASHLEAWVAAREGSAEL